MKLKQLEGLLGDLQQFTAPKVNLPPPRTHFAGVLSSDSHRRPKWWREYV
jgi:hypothetical protein